MTAKLEAPAVFFLNVTILAGLFFMPAGAADAEGATAAAAEMQAKTVLSKVYTVDQKYRSMKGPQSQQKIVLGSEENPELLWITGYKAVMVGADGETPMAQDFMCHSNLDINVGSHQQAVRATHGFSPRLFTLSQGQFEVQFPEGFGIPVASNEGLNLTTQVLNLNLEGQSAEVRHKVTVNYVRDAEAGSMQALFPVGAYGLVALEGAPAHYGMKMPMEEHMDHAAEGEDEHGPGCLPGQNAAGHVYTDPLGQKFSGHWVVPPGRQVNRTLVTRLMSLPYDSKVHYIAVHLHPFAESLELRDLTTGASIFKSQARNFDEKIGLAKVDYFSSVEGIPLHKDHDYEMVSVYNNTTDEEQDSMAVMYLYLADKVFDKSRVELKPAAPAKTLPTGKMTGGGGR